jgi:HPt (histidine-containing phosphotransfer) domain-containing protein
MFDRTKAIADFGLTEDMWDELFGDFLIQTQERVVQLRGALALADFDAIERLAHGLKGVAGNLRIEDMQTAAIVLEAAARERDRNKVRQAINRTSDLLREIATADPRDGAEDQ